MNEGEEDRVTTPDVCAAIDSTPLSFFHPSPSYSSSSSTSSSSSFRPSSSSYPNAPSSNSLHATPRIPPISSTPSPATHFLGDDGPVSQTSSSLPSFPLPSSSPSSSSSSSSHFHPQTSSTPSSSNRLSYSTPSLSSPSSVASPSSSAPSTPLTPPPTPPSVFSPCQLTFREIVQHGDPMELKRLLEEREGKINVNLFDPEGQTALHLSCLRGTLELVKLLVRFGADVRLANRDGWHPLHLAAYGGHNDIFLYLMSAGTGRRS